MHCFKPLTFLTSATPERTMNMTNVHSPFQLVLLALAAVAASQYVPGSDRDAQVVRNLYEAAIDDSFVTDVETSNGIVIKSYGESLPGPEPESGTSRQKGSYEYVDPEGRTVRVEWEADEFGYRARSDVIPEGADGQGAVAAAGAAPLEVAQDFQ